MPPTTRSASKRAADPSLPPGPVNRALDTTRKRAKKGKGALVDTGVLRCCLLEMPPEIRNRIYDFCTEQKFEEWYPPPSLRRTKKPAKVPLQFKSRTFFALTQACKLVRSEYRPLWLRQSSVRIDFDDVQSFTETFYLILPSYLRCYNAPRLMLISWDHEKEPYACDDILLDIRPLLELRAFTSSSTIQFICRRLMNNDLGDMGCWQCGQYITFSGGDSDDEADYESDTDSLYDYPCSHGDVRDEMYLELDREYAYLEALNDFLNNSNGAWIEALFEQAPCPMTVQCTMSPYCRVPTIYIRFNQYWAPSSLHKKSMYRSAAAYLSQMGIMGLESWKSLDFVVGISSGKFTRSSAGVSPAVPTYDQTHICGRMYKAPPTTIKAVGSGPNN